MTTSSFPSEERHVFVYGTLRRGECNDINRLQPAPRFLGMACLSGRLYDLGPYPGMRLGGEQRVHGEVYAITTELERLLDHIEEVAPEPTGEYTRREVDVDLDGRVLRCLVYEIAMDRVQGRAQLLHGDWLRR